MLAILLLATTPALADDAEIERMRRAVELTRRVETAVLDRSREARHARNRRATGITLMTIGIINLLGASFTAPLAYGDVGCHPPSCMSWGIFPIASGMMAGFGLILTSAGVPLYLEGEHRAERFERGVPLFEPAR